MSTLARLWQDIQMKAESVQACSEWVTVLQKLITQVCGRLVARLVMSSIV
jgi:hypothetical protein